MLRDIDPKTHMVVDLRDCAEIKGATAADIETGEVRVTRPTFDGPEIVSVYLPTGIRIVRR